MKLRVQGAVHIKITVITQGIWRGGDDLDKEKKKQNKQRNLTQAKINEGLTLNSKIQAKSYARKMMNIGNKLKSSCSLHGLQNVMLMRQ